MAGERYELVWLGAEYALWAWGTLREHWEQGIGVNSGLPLVAIPGGTLLFFSLRRGGRIFGTWAIRRASSGEIE